MPEHRWTQVDNYLAEALQLSDPVLEAALAANVAAGLPAIDVSPLQGQLLQVLTQITGAAKVLEIGTLGGYSTICMARGVRAGGKVITLEAEPRHAEVALANIARAGLSGVVDLRQGRALETLPELTSEAPFDLIFIDADKASLPDYLSWALRLSRPGTVIVGDNVVRDGEVADPAATDPDVRGVQTFLAMIGENARLSATVMQSVGIKGWDGLAIAVVLGDPA